MAKSRDLYVFSWLCRELSCLVLAQSHDCISVSHSRVLILSYTFCPHATSAAVESAFSQNGLFVRQNVNFAVWVQLSFCWPSI